jgi:small-conductance mechanosensitive channel
MRTENDVVEEMGKRWYIVLGSLLDCLNLTPHQIVSLIVWEHRVLGEGLVRFCSLVFVFLSRAARLTIHYSFLNFFVTLSLPLSYLFTVFSGSLALRGRPAIVLRWLELTKQGCLHNPFRLSRLLRHLLNRFISGIAL